MQVGKGLAVDLDYVLRDVDGNILDGTAASGPVTYIHGNGDLIPGLEQHLEGMRSGDEFDVTLEPQDGFGERDDSLTFEVPRHQLGPDIKPRKGMILTMEGPDGSDDPVTIVQVKPNSIVMDGNHPLAGVNLRFKGKVVAVRKATQADQHSCCTPAGCTANTH
jgi:FKBP-type peptidyl-prolyl cis-trans isomerase SlyD